MPDLTEGKIYQFRVKAVNKAGPSEPSDSSGQHLCKARYREWENWDTYAGFDRIAFRCVDNLISFCPR